MKRLFTIILALTLVFSIVGCGNQNDDSTQAGKPTNSEVCFDARIIEVHDTYFLVEPVEGSAELNSSDKIEVANKSIDSPLVPGVGSLLRITYDGMIQETYPARIANVYKIELLGELGIDIPELQNVVNYTEERLTNLLQGMSDADLVAQWGEPDSSLSGLYGDVWNIDDTATIIVYYDADLIIQEVKLSNINIGNEIDTEREETKSDLDSSI